MTHFETIVGLLVGIITVLSALTIGLRWIYRQGVASEELKNSIDVNTKATEELSINFKAYTVRIADQLLDHERRLTRLETTTELSRARGA